MNTFCEYFDKALCRSCLLLPMSYKDQLIQKESLLREKLNILPHELLPTVTSPARGFRNKVKLAVGQVNGQVSFGIVDKNFKSTDLSHCPVQHPQINQMLPFIKEFTQLSHLSVYDPTILKGELKHIIIYFNPDSNQSYLRFVLRSKEAHSRLIKHQDFLLQKIPHLQVLSINIQPSPHPILEGEEEIILTKATHLNHRLGDIHFKLSTQGFVQTNLEVSRKLYETASSWIKEIKSERFLELFSGQGAFSFFAATHVKMALGIEINKSAVESANLSARELNFPHLSFKCLDAKDIQDELTRFRPDLLLANPPRRGLGESIELINNSECEFFIYSSCNYETLSSDVRALTNYKIEKAQIFDMFAHTEHFETLVLLKRVT